MNTSGGISSPSIFTSCQGCLAEIGCNDVSLVLKEGFEMTVQMKDGFTLNGERFNLFAVSDGKLLSCKNCVGEAFGAVCTGCYRDSLAEYEVEDGILLLKETAAHVFDDVPSIATSKFYINKRPPRCEPGTVIPFTGQLIIYQSNRSVDFFGDIFEVSRAIELEFDEGLLVDQLDLADFIEAGRKHIETIPKDKHGLCEDRTFFTDFDYMMGIMREACPHSLRGRYSHCLYTWFFDRGECVLCESLDNAEQRKEQQ